MIPPTLIITMRIAETMARLSTCGSKHKVGAVLTSPNGNVIATGYNGPPKQWKSCDYPVPGALCVRDSDDRCITALHAEEKVIIECALLKQSPKGGYLYITLAPCIRCARLIVEAQIARVYYSGIPTSSNGLALLKDHVKLYHVYISKSED